MLLAFFHSLARDDPELLLCVDLAPIRVAGFRRARHCQDQEGEGARFLRTIGDKISHQLRNVAAAHRLMRLALRRARNKMLHHVFACRVRTIGA